MSEASEASMRTEVSATKDRDGTLRVDGAALFYRVRGSGPVLLMLPGSSSSRVVIPGGSFARRGSRLSSARSSEAGARRDWGARPRPGASGPRAHGQNQTA
jgi:hypothetical protein